MRTPPAEVEVGEDLVRSLVATQHRDLAHLPLVEMAAGWDNTLWRLGDDLLVRLPRRTLAASLTAHEQQWLPGLAPLLPLPISVPVRLGRPDHDYPWPWSIVAWIEGTPGDRAVISAPTDAATRLGRFLRALHHDAPPDAPSNPYRAVPLRDRAPAFDERLAELPADTDRSAIRWVWEQACAAPPWDRPPTWLHGDLHPANLVVASGTLAGVVDFGDLCAGDPATDLAGAWMLLPLTAMATFVDHYGTVDAALEARALGWAVLFATMLHTIDGSPTYEAVGRATLARVLEHTTARP